MLFFFGHPWWFWWCMFCVCSAVEHVIWSTIACGRLNDIYNASGWWWKFMTRCKDFYVFMVSVWWHDRKKKIKHWLQHFQQILKYTCNFDEKMKFISFKWLSSVHYVLSIQLCRQCTMHLIEKTVSCEKLNCRFLILLVSHMFSWTGQFCKSATNGFSVLF